MTDLKSFGNYKEDELLTFIGSAEQGSEHPLGEAMVIAAREKVLIFYLQQILKPLKATESNSLRLKNVATRKLFRLG